jgi:hypothetical protein
MALHSDHLPSRFPVGTKVVIEGRPARAGKAQVFSRYLEFPDGSFYRLPARPGRAATDKSRRRRLKRAR